MLNNKTELQALAAALAAELVAAESTGPGAKRGKTSDSAEAKALFDAKGLVKFIEALTEFIDNRTSHTTLEVIRQVVDQSIRIPAEQFPLFKALIRFEYIMAKNTQPA